MGVPARRGKAPGMHEEKPQHKHGLHKRALALLSVLLLIPMIRKRRAAKHEHDHKRRFPLPGH